MELPLSPIACKSCVDVAVPLPIPGPFSYFISPEETKKAGRGVRVRVPFKNRELTGYVVGVRESEPGERLKSVCEVLDTEPVISEAILDLTHWISGEYGSSWGEAIENALPRWVKYGKKAERALKKETAETIEVPVSVKDFELSPAQARALERIENGFEEADPKPVLLFGVTGSGKSEVYIRALRSALARGKTAICLVPEIALTEQLRLFFLAHFGPDLEILHSKLNDTEKFLAWKRLEKGQKRIVLGPRSAIFAPVPNLGLILMDEEHESSYKQETVPRYHARETAAWRARHEHALFVMGTATPSLETMARCEAGEIIKADLPERIDNRAMPEVRVVDMKREAGIRGKRSMLSINLVAEIERNLANKEGTLLLLNRRGFSTHLYNADSGDLISCKHCQVSLTFHQEADELLCHYCNFRIPASKMAAELNAPSIRFSGFGTERIESEVARRWPAARIARLDTDSIRKKGSHERILKDFRDQKIDILIGTQMIAKGFDFPHVTLVGVVLADVGLMLPDFRSAERTFQLLTQVAGRAGRGQKTGRVLIQTLSPQHPSVKYAKDHDYMSFYLHEMPSRREFHYPPFTELINFIVRSKDEKAAYLYARQLRDGLREGLLPAKDGLGANLEIIGPSPLPFYKLRGHFRWHVMIKAPVRAVERKRLWALAASVKRPRTVAMAIDVQPVNIL